MKWRLWCFCATLTNSVNCCCFSWYLTVSWRCKKQTWQDCTGAARPAEGKKKDPHSNGFLVSSPLKWQIISFIPIISIIPIRLIQNHPNQCKNTRFCNEIIHHFFGVLLLIPMDPSLQKSPMEPWLTLKSMRPQPAAQNGKMMMMMMMMEM